MSLRTRRSWRTRVAATSAAFAVTALVAGCGADSGDGTIELRYTFWGNPDRGERTDEAVALFEERNPGVKITTTYSEFGGYWQKLATEAAGGNAPDIIQMDYTYLREYSERGQLLDLTPHIGEELNVDDLLPGLDEAGMIGDEYFAVPVGRNMMAFQYDAAVWEESGAQLPEAGWTWEEFHEAIAVVRDHLPERQWATGALGEHLHMLDVLLRQEGKTIFTDEGELGFDEADLTEFWEISERMREDGTTIPPEVLVKGDTATALGKGQVIAEFGWDNFMASAQNTYGSELSLAPYPSDTDELGLYFKPSMLMSVSARSEHPEVAAEFIDFMINDPEVGSIFGANRGLPATNTQREQAELEGVDVVIDEYEASVEDMLGEPGIAPPPGGAGVERLMSRIDEEISHGRISIEEGVERFFREAEQTLSNP